ncbi:MAG: hypothetical protein BGN95_09510 [Sphingomonas sp. 66-10]|uniref:hypothetical protein n=1 Tax=Sphingomonas sp. 66-10 TaxID=1895848 RepID=UPI000928CEA5|nr:hypothetical protein [Sphingomonas sp. 66-10]OJU22420.1 MAG: hypothetical protein BGN95_09510 [Sphingomonas sp. 66-10]
MIAAINSEPDQRGSILLVGQDKAGHWLVQAQQGGLEGRFVSRDAAFAFARAERRSIPGATIELAVQPMISAVSFAPPAPDERAA